jgi:surfactin synthase thioesterase subunit
MSASDMEEWWEGLKLGAALEHTGVCFLQAPSKWTARSALFLPAWFTYIAEYDGAKEDEICLQSLDASLAALELIVAKVLQRVAPGLSISQVSCVGLSEGGCMALELARRVSFRDVITLASYRRSEFASERLLCPWMALTASEDAVYSRHWTERSLRGASVLRAVHDQHYLHNSSEAVADFLRECLAASSGVTCDE